MNIEQALQTLGFETPGVFSKGDIKKSYWALSRKYHPDVNPAGEHLMQQINAAYSALKDLADPVDCSNARAKTWEGDILEQFSEVLRNIVGLEGLVFELCGSWIWVTGDTWTHRAAIKAAGFNWSKSKAAWYWHPPQAWTRSRGSYSLDEIRERHGSQRIKQKQGLQLHS